MKFKICYERLLAAFYLTSVLIGQSSEAAEPKLSNEQIMSVVKQATWAFCHQPKRTIVDSRLTVMFHNSMWGVIASPVFLGSGGKRYCCAVDQDAFFDFSSSGRLLKTINADTDSN
ncbi:MAG: hypothetical protein ABI132_05165 [Rhodanobacteraceae bacterium]